jgi:hypothetical protein
MKKRPSARRLRPAQLTPVTTTTSGLQLNESCRTALGTDARTIAVRAIQEDLQQGALSVLPKDPVKAVATLLVAQPDEVAMEVARAIVELVETAATERESFFE